jgi:hypothetical protein
MIKAKLKQGAKPLVPSGGQGVSLIILLPAVALQAQGFKQLYLSNQAASEPYLFLLSHSAVGPGLDLVLFHKCVKVAESFGSNLGSTMLLIITLYYISNYALASTGIVAQIIEHNILYKEREIESI